MSRATVGEETFSFRPYQSDDFELGDFGAGEAEGVRYVSQGNETFPTKWPVSAGRPTEFAQGFAYGVQTAVLEIRRVPVTVENRVKLWDEWNATVLEEQQAALRRQLEAPIALAAVEFDFDPLAVFAGNCDAINPKFIDLCAGPGGWDEGLRILRAPGTIFGVDIDRDACATARAAGRFRYQSDITVFDPRRFTAANGLIISSPCPTFSQAGRSNDRFEDDVQLVLDAITGLGSDEEFYTDPADLRAQCSDPRTALAYEIARWSLLAPNVDWMVAENVPGILPIYEDLSGEMESFGWNSFDYVTVKAESFGSASRRERSFFVARRDYGRPFPVSETGLGLTGTTMRDALGWQRGERMNTRGQRKTSGGNEFSADQVAWCLTEKARSWCRVRDGRRLTPAEGGLLNGFRLDYPWRGSNSKRFLQVADVVNPLVGAAILGDAIGRPWREHVLAEVHALYGSEAVEELAADAPLVDPSRPHTKTSLQPSLFEF